MEWETESSGCVLSVCVCGAHTKLNHGTRSLSAEIFQTNRTQSVHTFMCVRSLWVQQKNMKIEDKYQYYVRSRPRTRTGGSTSSPHTTLWCVVMSRCIAAVWVPRCLRRCVPSVCCVHGVRLCACVVCIKINSVVGFCQSLSLCNRSFRSGRVVYLLQWLCAASSAVEGLLNGLHCLITIYFSVYTTTTTTIIYKISSSNNNYDTLLTSIVEILKKKNKS